MKTLKLAALLAAGIYLALSLPLLADESEESEPAKEAQEKPVFVPYEEPDLDLGLCDS
ncbi:hypothetical protein SAMN05660443_2895 [Marinospirillum celere]|uniref:Uncharacterized protein n=1 Tax=Marinospirillum celere TaxID=1122252 RepID=A0A1I1JQP3_9GAMM|nr:hypothetical protein [Marinospirillum celere]SFC50816.1 hypothetical protein SAMN05660443_2895 [Marinospirillum celere]